MLSTNKNPQPWLLIISMLQDTRIVAQCMVDKLWGQAYYQHYRVAIIKRAQSK